MTTAPLARRGFLFPKIFLTFRNCAAILPHVMKNPTYQHNLSVYRFSLGDCTLGGISSKQDTLEVVAVVTEKEHFTPAAQKFVADRVFDRNRDCAVVLIERELFGRRCDYIVPAADFITGQWTMMGGNYAHTSDGRWTDLYHSPLPVHDRVETRR